MTTLRLPLDERRTQIIEAVTAAVLEHGAGVTSRQLAEAAGIAEGTIFRSFGDKESLLLAIAEHHLDGPGALADLPDPSADSLERLVSEVVPILVERFRFVFRLMVALGPLAHRVAQERSEAWEESKWRLAEYFVPFRDQLRVPPVVAAELLRTLAYAAGSGWGSTPSLSPSDVVNVLLHGIATENDHDHLMRG